MTQYAKYIDENTIQRPRKNIKTPHLVAFNFNENVELMKAEGFFEVREEPKPEVEEGYMLVPRYSQGEGYINCSWVAIEVPAPEEEE